jgi:phosphoribosyl 1,2-cyclic phosphodiesterase
MEVISLQSGSAGNCVFVRSGETQLLFDAGIPGIIAQTRLADCGYDIRECNALVLSHEHSDHICGAGVFHRRFGIPVYANLRTWNAVRAKPTTGCLGTPHHFVSGRAFQIGSLRIETIKTPHDAVDGVCFIVEDVVSGQRFGLFTDVGHVFRELRQAIVTLDAVLLESNYDEEMLSQGPYPEYLKARISGKRGHISNKEAAELLDACDQTQMQWACLGHLSANNNTPEIAMATHQDLLRDRIRLFCAGRDRSLRLPVIEQPKFALKSKVLPV